MRVTQEMLDAFSDQKNFAGMGTADWEDEHIRAGLEAVFAHLLPGTHTMGDLGKAAYVKHAMTELVLRDRHLPPWRDIDEDLREAWQDAAWIVYMIGYSEAKRAAHSDRCPSRWHNVERDDMPGPCPSCGEAE